jgi:hypothetical protein
MVRRDASKPIELYCRALGATAVCVQGAVTADMAEGILPHVPAAGMDGASPPPSAPLLVNF